MVCRQRQRLLGRRAWGYPVGDEHKAAGEGVELGQGEREIVDAQGTGGNGNVVGHEPQGLPVIFPGALMCCDVMNILVLDFLREDFQHFLGEIEGRDRPGFPGERYGEIARAAADVEDGHVGSHRQVRQQQLDVGGRAVSGGE